MGKFNKKFNEIFKKTKTPVKISVFCAIFLIFLFLCCFLISFFQKPVFPIAPSAPDNFEKSKTSNIVFTTDKKYKDYLRVAILSAILNKKAESFYNIYVLGVDLSKKDIEEIESLAGFRDSSLEEENRGKEGKNGFLGNKKSDGKVKITVIPLKSKLIKNIKTNAKYSYRVSRADLFKFFIPEIFKNLDKILYLDCDVLVLDDLSKIYNFNLENKLIGALKEETNFENEENSKFNCGVILFDVKKCLENNLVEKLLISKSKDKTKRYLTQLAFTKALRVEEIKFFPAEFNYLLKNESENEINHENIIIAHFAGFKKPWHNSDIALGNVWWDYAHKINRFWNFEKRNKCVCLNYVLKDAKKEKNSLNLKKIKTRFDKCRANNEILLPIAPSAPDNFEKSKTSNIVFTTDKKYKDYLRVAILSAILNKKAESFYNIYVLGVDLSKKDIEEIESLAGFRDSSLESDGKIKITVLPLKLSMIDKVGKKGIIGRRHVSRADLFKFFIPEIFKNSDRILYLDSDIVVIDDLSRIFNFNLEDKLIGAVQESYGDEAFKYNCGVILFDVKKCLENKITQQLIKAKNDDKENLYISQSTFHKVLDISKTQKMPLEFNRFASDTQEDFVKNNYKKIYYENDKTINSIKDVDKKAVLIHFLAYKKPWQYQTMQFAPLWQKYAKKLNPDWKPKKERGFIKNFFLSLEITLAAHKEKRFNSIKSAYENFKHNFEFVEDRKPVFNEIEGIDETFDPKKTVNIVFSADKYYFEYIKTAIYSAIVNKNPDNYYNIYILAVDLSQKERKTLENIETYIPKNQNPKTISKTKNRIQKDKIKITTIPLKLKTIKKITKSEINFWYITQTDLYKFYLGEIFKNFNKILYLDSDILVLGDLEDLYNTNLEDKYIAAVKRYNFKGKIKKDDYNCGIMLVNLEKFRQDKISEKLVNAKINDKDGRSSQHSFTKTIPLEKVKLISPIYNNNMSTTDENVFFEFNFKKNYAPYLNNINSLKELDEKTIIAHFIGHQKPWHKNQNARFSEKWWEYTREINPSLKFQKRSLLDRLKLAYCMSKRSGKAKTTKDYTKKFFNVLLNES